MIETEGGLHEDGEVAEHSCRVVDLDNHGNQRRGSGTRPHCRMLRGLVAVAVCEVLLYRRGFSGGLRSCSTAPLYSMPHSMIWSEVPTRQGRRSACRGAAAAAVLLG